ncbi:MAG: hypothetical protein ACRDHE_18105 [Ktedonobacterales bacterium]
MSDVSAETSTVARSTRDRRTPIHALTSSRRNRILAGIAVPALLIMSSLAAVVAFHGKNQTAHAAAGLVPSGMPKHFSFGIMDAPGGEGYLSSMRSTNGTAWDYRYQYLSGGANTGHGWATWNSPTGQFATYYMQASSGAGIMPAFVYYQLLQSNGTSGSGQNGTDLAHLTSATTMNAYYADWALLMQKIGAYGKPVLVIVEPDLWGFMQQAVSGHGNSATSIPASVTSSGYADAQGFANNAQGFAWTLLHIRDKYAANAILALHASPWGTGTDIASDTSANVNATSIGAQTAQFLNTAGLTNPPTGISTFDVISNDIADHDSGQSGIWWDPTNTTFPNFNRYTQYASALSTGTNRRIVMWQAPVGNQYFDTENNSAGHTQDNKAQYILGHISAFANAGVIAVLFGPGNGGTNVMDVRQDGVTNPAPISTYQCNNCNNHASQYADDDGGYLRINLGQYYKSGGYPLNTGTATPTSTGSSMGTQVSNAPCSAVINGQTMIGYCNGSFVPNGAPQTTATTQPTGTTPPKELTPPTGGDGSGDGSGTTCDGSHSDGGCVTPGATRK